MQKMSTKPFEIKAMNIRLPRDLWNFLKIHSLQEEKSMNVLICECIEKLRKSAKPKKT